jgi:hypothetical protein
LPSVARFLPVDVSTFEPVAELDAFRHRQTEARVVNFNIALERWQRQAISSLIRDAVTCDLLDMHRRRFVVGRDAQGV